MLRELQAQLQNEGHFVAADFQHSATAGTSSTEDVTFSRASGQSTVLAIIRMDLGSDHRRDLFSNSPAGRFR